MAKKPAYKLKAQDFIPFIGPYLYSRRCSIELMDKLLNTGEDPFKRQQELLKQGKMVDIEAVKKHYARSDNYNKKFIPRVLLVTIPSIFLFIFIFLVVFFVALGI